MDFDQRASIPCLPEGLQETPLLYRNLVPPPKTFSSIFTQRLRSAVRGNPEHQTDVTSRASGGGQEQGPKRYVITVRMIPPGGTQQLGQQNTIR